MKIFEKLPVYMFSYKTEKFRTLQTMKEAADYVTIICREEEVDKISELFPNNELFILPEYVTDITSTFEYSFSKLVDKHERFIILDDDIKNFHLAQSTLKGAAPVHIEHGIEAFFTHIDAAIDEQLQNGNNISLFRPVPSSVNPAGYTRESSLNSDFTTMFYGVVSCNLKIAMENVVWNLSRLSVDNNLVMNSLLCGFSCYLVPTARFKCEPVRRRADEALDYKANCQFVKFFNGYCRMLPAVRSLHIWARGMRIMNRRRKLLNDSALLKQTHFIEPFSETVTLLKSKTKYGYRFLEVV